MNTRLNMPICAHGYSQSSVTSSELDDRFNHLPKDIYFLIFHLLTLRELGSLFLVSKHFKKAVSAFLDYYLVEAQLVTFLNKYSANDLEILLLYFKKSPFYGLLNLNVPKDFIVYSIANVQIADDLIQQNIDRTKRVLDDHKRELFTASKQQRLANSIENTQKIACQTTEIESDDLILENLSTIKDINLFRANQCDINENLVFDRLDDRIRLVNRKSNRDDAAYKALVGYKLLWSVNLSWLSFKSVRTGVSFHNCLLMNSKFMNIVNDKIVKIELDANKFIYANLKSVLFHSARIENCEFSSAYMYNAQIMESNIEDSVFVQVNLSHACISKVSLRQSDFSKAIFDSAALRSNLLAHVNLEATSFAHAIFNDVIIKHANMTGCHLVNAKITNSVLSNCDLTNANLNSLNLVNTCLFDSVLINVNLQQTTFKGCSITKCRFLPESCVASEVEFLNCSKKLFDQFIKHASAQLLCDALTQDILDRLNSDLCTLDNDIKCNLLSQLINSLEQKLSPSPGLFVTNNKKVIHDAIETLSNGLTTLNDQLYNQPVKKIKINSI